MDAAINVIASRGVSRTSIVAITNFAGLANGTFYIYFKNKAELIDQLGVAVLSTIVDAIHDPRLDDGDATHLVARHLHCFLHIASSEPIWLTMLIASLGANARAREHIARGIREDIDQGLRGGQFDVPDCEEVVEILLFLGRMGLERIRDGSRVDVVQLRIIEAALRVLGVDKDDARSIANETAALSIWEHFPFPKVITG